MVSMKNLKIGTRLGVGFAVILLLMVALTLVGILRMQSVGSMMDDLTDVHVRNERLATEWATIINVNAVRTSAAWKMSDPDDQKAFEADMKASSVRATQIQDQISTDLRDSTSKTMHAAVISARKAYVDTRNAVFKAKSAGDLVLGKKLFDIDLLAARVNYLETLRQLTMRQGSLLDASAAQIRAEHASGRNLMLSLVAVALMVGIGFAAWISRSITRPIYDAVRVAETVASGDLTSSIVVGSRDETGKLMQALKNMNDSLLHIVGQVRSGTETIATASKEIADGNMDLSSRTEEQASSLGETASSMEELTATVKLNADNARQANKLAIDASDMARRGGTVVSEVVTTMGSINESSRKIVDIISVIDGIAFQTNILALNAAVEAARAGEQGRGFAVVAAEVRNLAHRSAAAAKEIKQLIGDSVAKADAGSILVERAGQTMSEIVHGISSVTHIMNDITAAGDEQQAGIEQVNLAIMQMDQVTQQNAALVEQAAAAAESMQEQAAKLAQVVDVFKTT